GLDVVDCSGQGGRGPQQSTAWIGDDLHVHAVLLVLPGVEGPVGRYPVDRQQRAVQDHECLGGCGTAVIRRSGASAARTSTASATYRYTVAMPTSNPAARRA